MDKVRGFASCMLAAPTIDSPSLALIAETGDSPWATQVAVLQSSSAVQVEMDGS